MTFNYVEKYRASSAKIHCLENELGKLKAEHLACDVERRRLAIELKVKNDEVEYLTKKLGFSKDAEAMLIARYDQTLVYNREVEAEVGKLMSEQLDWDFERRKMERNLEVKNGELEDLSKKLGFSKDTEAKAINRYDQALEYNREVEAKVEELKREFDRERGEMLGMLTDLKEKLMEKELELGDLNEKLRGIYGKLEADSASESHVNDVKCCWKSRKYRESTKSTMIYQGKLVGENGAACHQKRNSRAYIQKSDGDDDFSDASNHEQDAKIEIFLRSHDGNTISMRVEPFLTIDGLKSKIYLEKGCPPHQQRLVFGKQKFHQLEGSHTLADYDIQEKSTIHLVWLF